MGFLIAAVVLVGAVALGSSSGRGAEQPKAPSKNKPLAAGGSPLLFPANVEQIPDARAVLVVYDGDQISEIKKAASLGHPLLPVAAVSMITAQKLKPEFRPDTPHVFAVDEHVGLVHSAPWDGSSEEIVRALHALAARVILDQ